jgi:hypothetical protein
VPPGVRVRVPPCPLFVRRLRGALHVEIELDQLDGAVGCELSDYREPRHEKAGCDQDPIVLAARNDGRELLEPRRKNLDDAKKLEDLEIVRGGFTIRASLRSELTVEVLEERWGRTNRLAGARHDCEERSVASMRSCTRDRT